MAASRHLELQKSREMRKQYELSLEESRGIFDLCLGMLVLSTLVGFPYLDQLHCPFANMASFLTVFQDFPC